MTIIEKVDKALDSLSGFSKTSRIHELQNNAGVVGRCLGVIGSKANLTHNFTRLFNRALPVLLSLASDQSADVRLLGEEALNRSVVGGGSFHSSKINTLLLNALDSDKNARWNRAILSRIYLGEVWLRPGSGRIRSQIQLLQPKLIRIIRNGCETQLFMETLETNLPRIMDALSDYFTDEEMIDLTNAFLEHVSSSEAPVRRGTAFCIGLICKHNHLAIGKILDRVIDNLWPEISERNTIVGWFGTLKSLLQHVPLGDLRETNNLTVAEFLEVYQLCIHYLEVPNTDHNVQNAVMECLQLLLTQCCHQYKSALLDPKPLLVEIGTRRRSRKHSRCISSLSMTAQSINSLSSRHSDDLSNDMSNADITEELKFSGGLRLGSFSELQTPIRSSEDLSCLQTPDSPTSDSPLDNHDTYTRQLSEKLEGIFENTHVDISPPMSPLNEDHPDEGRDFKCVNIGSSADSDIRLKYCFRLIVSKFLLSGNSGNIVPDRVARVSLKANSLNCIAAMLMHYPELMAMFLDKEYDLNFTNCGATDTTDASMYQSSNPYILERNVCFQDSITDSFSREFFNKNIDNKIDKSTTSKIETLKSLVDSSLKDIPSNILDVKSKTDLGVSLDSTIPNMSNSNFTNMTNSNDLLSTGYPMTSSGDLLTSSVDHIVDHFDNKCTVVKKPLQRTDMGIDEVDAVPNLGVSDLFKEQHCSEIFPLLEDHSDPQIRGLLRVTIVNYLRSVLDLTHGEYYKWKTLEKVSMEFAQNLHFEKLVKTVLKGLSDEVQSCTNQTLNVLGKLIHSLSMSVHVDILPDILNALILVEGNKYWLCKVNLCKLYEDLCYKRLSMVCPSYKMRSKHIMDALIRLLADNDHKVRNAASSAITEISTSIYPPSNSNELSKLLSIYQQLNNRLHVKNNDLLTNRLKYEYFLNDLPDQIKCGTTAESSGNLRTTISHLMVMFMSTGCKHFSHGLLETLHSLASKYLPWRNIDSFISQGILELCLDKLDFMNNSVNSCTLLLDLASLLYPVEIYKCIKNKSDKSDPREPLGSPSSDKWVHIGEEKISKLAEKFMTITLKLLNIIVHLVEDINVNVYTHKHTIPLPGSPVRKKTQESLPKRSNTTVDDDKLRRRPTSITHNTRAKFVGHFVNDPFYMKLYESLRSAYSNHKVNLDKKSSVFYHFTTSVLNALAVQLELGTELEFSQLSEEILYNIKTILPLSFDKSINCVTQFLKCIFGTNMAANYEDVLKLFEDEMSNDCVKSFDELFFAKDIGVNRMESEQIVLKDLEVFDKRKIFKKWTNKTDMVATIKMFEPVVLQGLQCYVRQHDLRLQSEVLRLLRQLLTLRINYCRLDSELVFIKFVISQLEIIEQGEIPKSCELVHGIVHFLVQVSTSKYNTKKIIEIPKVIRQCDGLLASGCESEAIVGLGPLVFHGFFVGDCYLPKNQDAQVAREVIFYMLQKTMYNYKVVNLTSTVLCLSRERPETYIELGDKALDALLNLMLQLSVDLNCGDAVQAVENFMEYVPAEVLMEQSKIELGMKIMFQTPPDENSSCFKTKERYIATMLIMLRKFFIKIPENDALLTINFLKAKHVSPKSIFFYAKSDVDPLNVNPYNEDCANLDSQVILVRYFLRLLTYAVLEMDMLTERDTLKLESYERERDGDRFLFYSLVVDLVSVIKDILHLNDNSLFPQTSTTAQQLIQNEQSNLNTGLYNPDENIPLAKLNSIVIKHSYRLPLLTVNWSHMLLRLKVVQQSYWECVLGRMKQNASVESIENGRLNMLQVGCVLAFCEFFVENGLNDAIYLSWLIVNRIQVLIKLCREPIVRKFFDLVNDNSSASGLLLQAIAARCQKIMKGDFASKTYEVLKSSHESQCGVVVFLICRVIGKMELAIGTHFANLAIERMGTLAKLPTELLTKQLSSDDVAVAFELLKRDKVHIRYPSLMSTLNLLATCALDMSPLDLSQERTVNPQHILTTNVSEEWLLSQIKLRCCKSANDRSAVIAKRKRLASALSNLNSEQINTVFNCPEFDRNILYHYFNIACDQYLKEFLKNYEQYETVEIEREKLKESNDQEIVQREETVSLMENNILSVANLVKFKRNDSKDSNKSQFFVPMKETKLEDLKIEQEPNVLKAPELNGAMKTSLSYFDKSMAAIVKLFPKQSRPLSQSEDFVLNSELIMNKYLRCCHQVFSDKEFLQEFITMHSILKGYLRTYNRIRRFLDSIDCEDEKELFKIILPESLAKNLASFSVITLQYLSFLVKNKNEIDTSVSFRVNDLNLEHIPVENVIYVSLKSISTVFEIREIVNILNLEENQNRVLSAVGCLYAAMKYLVKDTKPIVLKNYMRQHCGENVDDFSQICDKMLTMIDYFETNFYSRNVISHDNILPMYARRAIERILCSLARLHSLNTIALIPSIAWPTMEVVHQKGEIPKVGLPLHVFQDFDILEPFLFRMQILRSLTVGIESCESLFDDVNLEMIPFLNETNYDFGYTYGQFSVEYLRYVAGISPDASFHVKNLQKLNQEHLEVDLKSCLQLLMDMATEMLTPKSETELSAKCNLIACLVAISDIFTDVNEWIWLSRQLISLTGSEYCNLTQYSIVGQYLLYGLARATAVLNGIEGVGDTAVVYEKLLKSLASNHAPLKMAALHGCLLLVHPQRRMNADTQLVDQLVANVTQYLGASSRISLYEQSLYWTLLFTLVELGNFELMNKAVDFILRKPRHFCTDLIVKGVCSMIRQSVLPKDIKKTIIGRFLDEKKKYCESHNVQLIMVHLFSADNKLISPRLAPDVSNMDPDVLMSTVERLTLLYKTLRENENVDSQLACAIAIRYLLREALPPIAAVSRVVIEFLECCKHAERKKGGIVGDRSKWVERTCLSAEIVFELFETAVSQNQLPTLIGWIFEALTHLLSGKVSNSVVPLCLLNLLLSASPNENIRKLSSITINTLNNGLMTLDSKFERVKMADHTFEFDSSFHKMADKTKDDRCNADKYGECSKNLNKSSSKMKRKSDENYMSFADRRLLCTVALHSEFSYEQLEKLRELCAMNSSLNVLHRCLNKILH